MKLFCLSSMVLEKIFTKPSNILEITNLALSLSEYDGGLRCISTIDYFRCTDFVAIAKNINKLDMVNRSIFDFLLYVNSLLVFTKFGPEI